MNFNLPSAAHPERRFHVLSEEDAHSAFTLCALLEKIGRWEGPAFHRTMGEWVESGLKTADDLLHWLRGRFPSNFIGQKDLDRAHHQAELRRGKGLWAASIRPDAGLPPQSFGACPRLLLGTGDCARENPWIAVFNSRKPRSLSPDDEWLRLLRSVLPQIGAQSAGFAGSIGTLTYDLVAAFAEASGLPLLLVLPFCIEDIVDCSRIPLVSEGLRATVVLTCLSRAVQCPKPTRMVCRDRLLAFLADCHLVLGIRSGGNLLSVLLNQQEHNARPQWVYHPSRRDSQAEGNLELLAKYSQWGIAISTDGTDSTATCPDVSRPPLKMVRREAGDIPWNEYLYHYTRAFPGPWPGQTYREYLLSLLNGEPLLSHAALDTLIRIVMEKRIRAGSRLIRGNEKAVCWSARPPMELESIRRWNPALIRWTFEPYGIAVPRKFLRSAGAEPTIYAGDDAYPRLKLSVRYRFQRHAPPRCSWKHEREWRLPEDMMLESVPPDQGFLFVPTHVDADRLASHVISPFPIVIIDGP